MKYIESYINFAVKKPLYILFFTFLFILISFFGIKNFKLDASSDALILEGDESFRVYQETEEEFGDSSFLIITIEPKEDLFSQSSIDLLKSLQSDLKNLDGVDSVLSLLDAPIFFQPKVGLTEVADNLKDIQTPGIDLAAAKDEIINNPIYKELIISNDGLITAMQITLKGNNEYNELISKRYEILDYLTSSKLKTSTERKEKQFEFDLINERIGEINEESTTFNANLVKNIRDVLDKYKNTATIYLGGPSMIATDMMEFIKSDLVLFGSCVALIFAIMLYMFFGNIWFVVFPILNAFLTVFVTSGFLGFMNWKISVVSSNFIALLLILTISLTVHVLVKINELKKDNPNFNDVLVNAMKEMITPCFFAAITTAVAFLSLLTGDIKPVIEFGKMMAFGISIAFISTFSFLPSSLALISNPKTSDKLSLHLITNKLFALTKNYPSFVAMVFISTFIIFVFGASKVDVENRFIDYFDSDTEIYQGMLEIDNNLGGTATLDIIINQPKEDEIQIDESFDDFFEEDLFDDDSSSASGYWWNIYSLQQLEEIHDYLDSLPEIGKVLSVASGIKLAREINDNKDLNDLELALLRSVLPEDIRESLLYSYINEDDSIVRISTRVNESYEALNRNELLKKIDSDLQSKFNLKKDQYELTGLAVLYNNMLQSLFQSQIGSLGLVFSVIALMFLLIFKSIKIMLIGLIPNLFVASSVIGLLGLLSLPLDIMTITVAAISVGMAVDNSIHYMYRYKKEMKLNNKNILESLKNAHLTSGRAIFYTAATIATGFSILVISNFFPTRLFGVFTAIAMVLAFLSSLTILPTMLYRLRVFK